MFSLFINVEFCMAIKRNLVHHFPRKDSWVKSFFKRSSPLIWIKSIHNSLCLTDASNYEKMIAAEQRCIISCLWRCPFVGFWSLTRGASPLRSEVTGLPRPPTTGRRRLDSSPWLLTVKGCLDHSSYEQYDYYVFKSKKNSRLSLPPFLAIKIREFTLITFRVAGWHTRLNISRSR